MNVTNVLGSHFVESQVDARLVIFIITSLVIMIVLMLMRIYHRTIRHNLSQNLVEVIFGAATDCMGIKDKRSW